jgi:hypothetical protein
MKRTHQGIVAVTVGLLAAMHTSGVAQESSKLQVAVSSRAIQPGEVIRLDVACTCATAPGPVTATAFGRRIALVPVPGTTIWQGLIGIDLDTRPGTFPVTIAVERAEGSPLTARHELRVLARSFPTRRLRVADSYVSPPQDALKRLHHEAGRLQALFDTISPHAWSGPYVAPVTEPAAANFGARSMFNGQPRSPHSGIDFPSRPGTPVIAPGAGTVALAEDLFFTGNTVIIDHGLGLYSMLAHLSALTVTAGDRIQGGQVVGFVGATGRATGPHLHWGMRLNAARVDPLSLLAIAGTGSTE